jgi:hypothetical protein
MKRGIVNLVCGVIGIGLLSAFLIGLAISIGDIAFGIVVAVVLLLAIIEFLESARDGLRRDSNLGS